MNADTLIGQQLDTFLIQQPLGRGGMARVYKGLDMRLKRPVAIKVIDDGLRASDTYAQRFEREAQAVASLKHPNIVTIFHFGQHDRLYYLVMEYIDGTDLDAIVRRYESGKELMPHADVIRVLEAIGAALDYAHGQGVIHRDVKPSNIMLERDGRPVLTDFGLALRVSEGSIGDTFGSPHYISPEQARSSANAIPQSDLYSLGVVAYELLTGVLPFDDPSPTALAMQHIMAAVPSPLTFNRNLSPSVEAVLFKILAKDPAERYQTAADFVTALRSALEALKTNPAKLSTADLPPGAVSVPPRRLSMQTALDKVSQEMAFTQARGQALTRSPTASTADTLPPPAPTANQRRGGWTAYLIAGVGALIALIVFGLILNDFLSRPAVVATSTLTPQRPANNTPTALAAVPTQPTLVPPTNTAPPSPTAIIPTATATLTLTLTPTTLVPSAVPTDTLIPTVVPTLPPSSTPLPTTPPTLTPSSNTPIPPTAIPVVPTTASGSPTVAYPNGKPITLNWDSNGFRLNNQTGQLLYVSNLAFEQLDPNDQPTLQFQAERWAAYYPRIYPSACAILEVKQDAATYTRADCLSGVNVRIVAHTAETFWLAQNGAIEFRVLWGKLEVGRCVISTPPCTVNLPPA